MLLKFYKISTEFGIILLQSWTYQLVYNILKDIAILYTPYGPAQITHIRHAIQRKNVQLSGNKKRMARTNVKTLFGIWGKFVSVYKRGGMAAES